MTATKTKPPAIKPTDIAVALVNGRKAIEAFVTQLAPDQVVPFLVKAAPFTKDMEHAVKIAETRVSVEELVKTREWKDKEGQSHVIGEYVDTETGEQYVFAGSQGDLYVADPVMLRADLEMLDVPKAELDQAIYPEWKVSFTNLKNIENTALRALDSSRTPDDEKARARSIVATIREHRERKKDGPPHLKPKE